jgi:hypothetical protein
VVKFEQRNIIFFSKNINKTWRIKVCNILFHNLTQKPVYLSKIGVHQFENGLKTGHGTLGAV